MGTCFKNPCHNKQQQARPPQKGGRNFGIVSDKAISSNLLTSRLGPRSSPEVSMQRGGHFTLGDRAVIAFGIPVLIPEAGQ